MPGPMMSEIVKKMAEEILIHGEDAPFQAQRIALLLVNYAWNQAIGFATSDVRMWKREIAKAKRKMPDLWDEFVDSDPDVLIDKLVQRKLETHPNDERLIVGVQLAPDARYSGGGRIRVAYVPKEQHEAFQKFPEAKQQAMLLSILNSED